MEEIFLKKLVREYLMIVAVLLMIVAAVVFVFDPFFHYHKPWFGLSAIQDKHQYQVYGAIEHLDYDSILLGSSVSMSVNTNVLDERFDCKTIKAVGNSAMANQLERDLEQAFARQELKYVFYGLDVFSMYTTAEDAKYPEETAYLCDKNPFNDVRYLWNGEILLSRIPDLIKISKAGVYDEGMAYQFNALQPCGPDMVLQAWQPAPLTEPVEQKPADYERNLVKSSLARLETIVAEHPDTQFMFYLPPYGIYWWDNAYRDGKMDTYMSTLNLCMEQLLAYDNAEFYATDFNDPSVITDSYQYIDSMHGGTQVTDRMGREIGDADQRITLKNYKDQTEKLERVLMKFEDMYQEEGVGVVYRSGGITLDE